MKTIISVLCFLFATTMLQAQTSETKSSTKSKKTATTAKKKKRVLSHSGPGIENTGTTAITLTHNDTVNYQGNGKKPSGSKSKVNKKQ